MLRRAGAGPIFVLLAAVVCAIVNPGNFGTLDTVRRLQAERWIRLGEPAVLPADAAAGFGLTGRGGVVYPWYGVGQSLVLLPFDALADATVKPLAGRLGFDAEKRRQIAELSIAFLMQAVLTSAVLLLARGILTSYGFPAPAASAGALSLLFATTCLAYVQCAQENELLLVLALASLFSISRWQQTGAARWAALAGATCGFAILVRLTSVLDAAVFGGLALLTAGYRRRFAWAFAPGVAAGLLIDRWYHWLRFGEWFSTYMGILGRQGRPPGAPESYPFSYPFAKGFLGAFFAPDKSLLWFDPLLVLLMVLAACRWRNLDRRLRPALLALSGLLLLYIAVFARYYGFGGDSAWGHRFLTPAVELLALFAVPILLTAGRTLPRAARSIAWGVVVLAVALQALSTTLSSNVEVAQRDFLHSTHSVLVNRVENFGAVVSGRTSEPRFAGMPPEYRTLVYLPFQLRFRFPDLAKWAVATWWLLLAAAGALVWTILRRSGVQLRLTQPRR